MEIHLHKLKKHALRTLVKITDRQWNNNSYQHLVFLFVGLWPCHEYFAQVSGGPERERGYFYLREVPKLASTSTISTCSRYYFLILNNPNIPKVLCVRVTTNILTTSLIYAKTIGHRQPLSSEVVGHANPYLYKCFMEMMFLSRVHYTRADTVVNQIDSIVSPWDYRKLVLF